MSRKVTKNKRKRSKTNKLRAGLKARVRRKKKLSPHGKKTPKGGWR